MADEGGGDVVVALAVVGGLAPASAEGSGSAPSGSAGDAPPSSASRRTAVERGRCGKGGAQSPFSRSSDAERSDCPRCAWRMQDFLDEDDAYADDRTGGGALRVGAFRSPAASAGAVGPPWMPRMGRWFGMGRSRIGFGGISGWRRSRPTLARRRGERRVATQAPTPAALTPQRPLLPSIRVPELELRPAWGRGWSRSRIGAVAGAGVGAGAGVVAGAGAGAGATVELWVGLSAVRLSARVLFRLCPYHVLT